MLFRSVMTLTEDGDGTLLTLRGAPINASEDERARYRSHRASMQAGFGASMDALEAYLKEVEG